MSNHNQLAEFIARYNYSGYDNEIDWRRVSDEFGGVHFYKADDGTLPRSYYTKYNESDGCWVLSLDVDSVCIWNAQCMGPTSWTRRKSSAAAKSRRATGSRVPEH